MNKKDIFTQKIEKLMKSRPILVRSRQWGAILVENWSIAYGASRAKNSISLQDPIVSPKVAGKPEAPDCKVFNFAFRKVYVKVTC